jgi:hypothetical protein
MLPWDKRETGHLIERVFGRAQAKLAEESMRSVTDRQSFSSFHFAEVQRLVRDFERRHMAGTATILELHAAGAEKKERAFQRLMIEAGAHATAALQSLHALPDIFAHVLYFATAQDKRECALDEAKVSAPSVARCLQTDARFLSLAAPLKALQSGAGWKHLAAISNSSKHRSVVRASYNEDWTGTRAQRREIQFSEFRKGSSAFPSTGVKALLEPEYVRLMSKIIEAAHLLNEQLRAHEP